MSRRKRLTPLERLRRWLCPVHGACLTQYSVEECDDVGKCTREGCTFWVPSQVLYDLDKETETRRGVPDRTLRLVP